MDNFIVSARKYRPATFDMVVGQDTITTTLKNAIRNNHLAQAYLFCGPRGVGKTTCARIFAKTINCSDTGPDGEACDKCESCLSFNSQASFNIHELDGASNNSVDDIRNLTDQVRIPPQIGKFSVYIIDEVHMLSASAFNAFLKTLEEPPAHAIFILATTEKHKIIPTILSRCQIFDFNRINVDDIVNRLSWVAGNEEVIAEHEALHVIATKADGAMRDALSIFDQIVSFSGKKITYGDVISNLNVLDYEYYFRITTSALEGSVSSVLLTYNEILNKGFDGYNFMAGLNNHMRDLLVSRDEATVKLLETSPSIRQRYREQAVSAPLSFLYEALEIGSQCMLTFKSSKNQRLHVELALMRMCNTGGEKTSEESKKKAELQPGDADKPIKQSPPSSAPPTFQTASVSQSRIEAPEKKAPPADGIEKKISIKNIVSGTRTDISSVSEPEIAAVREQPLKEFSEEELYDAWNSFALAIKEESPRISVTLSAVTPELLPDKTVILKLDNSALKEAFDHNFRARLEHHLRDTLMNGSVKLQTTVEATERGDILYSVDQKFNHLASKNPALKELKKTFNLDFE
ncbi:MAG: DNA polymerase III subunit gamma/tau [Bacteroidales bacterium]|jgi:DNA polymerase-3 subunit gamma/tau|nr:DNA polymerase III subunit gamma/tau [Bacteroidales bacterium]